VLSHAALQLHNATFYWTDPWSIFLYEKLQTRVKDSQALKLHDGIHQDALTIIRDQPARTFAIIHYPLPHHPYITDPGGGYRGPDSAAWDKSSVEGYERNLRCLDHAVGGIVESLKAAGRFDEAVLVLTSDHSWRNDPAVPAPSDEVLEHVPLIVKFPGQTEPSSVTTEFETHRIGELIARALQAQVPATLADAGVKPRTP
jgi:membrane-anchored protein YejM (alkaline phosphatase superfamily)